MAKKRLIDTTPPETKKAFHTFRLLETCGKLELERDELLAKQKQAMGILLDALRAPEHMLRDIVEAAHAAASFIKSAPTTKPPTSR